MKSLEFKKFQESLQKVSEGKFNDMILEFCGIWRKLRNAKSEAAKKAANDLATSIGSKNLHDINMESIATNYFMKRSISDLASMLNLARDYLKKFCGSNCF